MSDKGIDHKLKKIYIAILQDRIITINHTYTDEVSFETYANQMQANADILDFYMRKDLKCAAEFFGKLKK